MLQVEAVPVGAESRTVLRQWIRQLQADDPMRPVTVAVPSNYAGLALRRALARPEAHDPGGLLNVRFLVLPRVIELLGAPLLAARDMRPLTRAIEAELIRAALDDDPGVFASVTRHPATEQRLAAAFRDLGDMTLEERAALALTEGPVADTVRLFDRVETSISGRFYHDRALAEAAAAAAREGHAALRDLGALVVYLPAPLSRAERAFIEALAEATDAVVLPGHTGDAVADTPVLEQWLEQWDVDATGPVVAVNLPMATHIASAPDAEEEVRAVIRACIGLAAEGTPLHRIAILSRHSSPYTMLIEGQMEAAGLPWNGTNPYPLAQTVAGRVLLGALRLPEHDYRRGDLTAWLSGAPILLREHGDLVPAHRWDALARRAGVIGGAEAWSRQLARLEATLRDDLLANEQADEPSEAKAAGLQRNTEELQALAAFIAELIEVLHAPPLADWATYSGWALEVLERYAGSETSFGNRLTDFAAAADGTSLELKVELEVELEAYRAIADTLRGLEALGEIRRQVDLGTFQRVLAEELNRPARRISRFGGGIFVGRISDADGTDFDHVFILGMNEGSLPTRGSDDPLIPDSALEGVAGASSDIYRPRRARQRAEERRLYLAALAAAPQRTLLAPRADLRGSQARLRSRWLLESASHLGGRRLTNEAMEQLHGDSADWHTYLPSFESAIRAASHPGSVEERDLQSLLAWGAAGRELDAHPLTQAHPALLAGWAEQRAHRSTAFSRWDGRIGSLPADLSERTLNREHSPTSLQRWATCPRQYLFTVVLGLAERDEPEMLLTISPLKRGSLIHSVLERFITERPPATPETAWSAEDRARLRAIAEEECAAAVERGVTGLRLLWQHDRDRIIRDLEAFADHDEAFRRHYGVVPVATELAYGGDLPVALTFADGREVRLRGRIDRVDRSPDGARTIVVDYKSGSRRPYEDLSDPVQAGRLLQLPFYALGAQAAYEVGDVESYYWFTNPDIREDRRLAGYPVDAAVLERLRGIVAGLLDGITAGVFPSVPGDDGYGDGAAIGAHCRYCPFDAVCPRDRAKAYERKLDAPEMMPFLSLVPAATGDPGDAGASDSNDDGGTK